jgi:hypothetical protein
MSHHDGLYPHTTAWFDSWLKQILPDSKVTPHSIKSAAIGVLAEAVADGRLAQHILPIVAKHKAATPTLPTTTLRYIRDVTTKAHMLETYRATILLPW